jgi:hypothetical protein
MTPLVFSTRHGASKSMTALKNTGIRIVALVVLQSLWLGTSHSQTPGSPKIDEEVSKQEAIYQSRGEKVPAGYVVDRSLLSYTSILPADFLRSLADLGPTDRWLDIGAGEGHAVLDYYTTKYDSMSLEGRGRLRKRAQAVAMSIEDRRTPRWHQIAAGLEPNQIQYLFGRRLREYSSEELGQFRLITDHLGGFSYTRDLSLFMEKVLSFLELNGVFFTLLLDVLPETEADPALYKNLLFLTEIENADGSAVRVCSWLKSISCVQVTCELNAELERPIEVYRMQKVCDNVTVPSLVSLSYEAGTPPTRRYQLRSPSPASPGRASTTR